jgi:hypothetical protein
LQGSKQSAMRRGGVRNVGGWCCVQQRSLRDGINKCGLVCSAQQRTTEVRAAGHTRAGLVLDWDSRLSGCRDAYFQWFLQPEIPLGFNSPIFKRKLRRCDRLRVSLETVNLLLSSRLGPLACLVGACATLPVSGGNLYILT